MGTGLCNRFVDAVVGGDQRQSYPVQVPSLLAVAGGGKSVKMRQTVFGVVLGKAEVGEDTEDPVVPVRGATEIRAKGATE
ncbi:hypothetical protein ACFUJ0_34645 [Streptomyces sp. NPDC057242]|uniref:hypothetical protein n=1 Tax=unclassified Streptomyces TaxID=2593676 RepID=UPI0036318F40